MFTGVLQINVFINFLQGFLKKCKRIDYLFYAGQTRQFFFYDLITSYKQTCICQKLYFRQTSELTKCSAEPSKQLPVWYRLISNNVYEWRSEMGYFSMIFNQLTSTNTGRYNTGILIDSREMGFQSMYYIKNPKYLLTFCFHQINFLITESFQYFDISFL